MRETVYDLFCGAGGASKGYADAGFDVIGVDRAPQPHYPYPFIQEDALEWLARFVAFGHDGLGDRPAFIHASPPCQAYTATTGNMVNSRDDHPRLIAPVRVLLRATGVPYVIENVEGARRELVEPVRLCGSSFGLGIRYDGPTGPHGWHGLRRHRLFETNWRLPALGCVKPHPRPSIGVYGDHARWASRSRRAGDGQYADTEKMALASEAMGIDWMTWGELKEAIPPAYTTYVGIRFRAWRYGHGERAA